MDHTNNNRELANNYKPKNDGSMADGFMKGLKKHFQEYDALTPKQKYELRKHYKQQMRLIRISILENLNNVDQ